MTRKEINELEEVKPALEAWRNTRNALQRAELDHRFGFDTVARLSKTNNQAEREYNRVCAAVYARLYDEENG